MVRGVNAARGKVGVMQGKSFNWERREEWHWRTKRRKKNRLFDELKFNASNKRRQQESAGGICIRYSAVVFESRMRYQNEAKSVRNRESIIFPSFPRLRGKYFLFFWFIFSLSLSNTWSLIHARVWKHIYSTNSSHVNEKKLQVFFGFILPRLLVI